MKKFLSSFLLSEFIVFKDPPVLASIITGTN